MARLNRWRLDLRDAARSLLHSPGFTLAAILTLSLGIGATASVFTVAWRVLLRPLPYQQAGRLVAVFTTEVAGTEARNPTSPANFLDWRRSTRTLEDWTAAHVWSPTMLGTGAPDQLAGIKASRSLFALLGAEPALGTVFSATDDGADPHQVVLSHDLWRRRFGSQATIVGRKITLDGEPFTVTGVMPTGFQFPPFWATGAELWAPLDLTAEQASKRQASFLRVFARLAPGRTVAQARSELRALMTQMTSAYPDELGGLGVSIEPLREPVVSSTRRPVSVLLCAVLLVLAVACANVASLFVTRGLDRESELAVRSALGGSRAEIARRVLAESVLVAIAGGLGGWMLAAAAVRALHAIAPAELPRLEEIHLDLPVLAFTAGVSCLAALASGLIPALRALRRDPAKGLRAAGRMGGGRRARLWPSLVIGQVSMALVLLAGAGLLTRSLVELAGQDPGFETRGLLTADLPLAGSAEAPAERQPAFFASLLDAVRAVPGVEGAGLVNHLPIAGDVWRSDLAIESRPELDPPPKTVMRTVSSGYFQAMGTPIVRGRAFDGSERADGRQVVVVNQALAALLPRGVDPVGQHIRLGIADAWLEVVGVSADVRQDRLSDPVAPEVDFPYSQNPFPWFEQTSLVVRLATPLAAADPESQLPAVRQAVWSVDPALPVVRAGAMERALAADLAASRFLAALLGCFAVVASLLAAVGLYGLLSFQVGRRRRELGIRMALGAGRGSVVRLVLREGTILAAFGVGIGVLLAASATRALASLLHRVEPTDLSTFVSATCLLLLVALAASCLPALQATRVDPVESLRRE